MKSKDKEHFISSVRTYNLKKKHKSTVLNWYLNLVHNYYKDLRENIFDPLFLVLMSSNASYLLDQATSEPYWLQTRTIKRGRR